MVKDKKTPRNVSGKRYRDMYDAYRDEVESDDSFWKDLERATGRSVQSAKPASAGSAAPRTAGTKPAVARTADTTRTAARAEGGATRTAGARPAAARTERAAEGTQRAVSRTAKPADGVSKAGRKEAAPKRPATPGPDDGDGEESEAARRRRNRQRAQEKKARRGRRMFLVFLAFWAVILLIGGFFVWRYTDRCLQDYEKSQVANCVGRLLQEFEVKARDGSLGRQIEVPELSGEFESKDIVKEEYLAKLAAVGTYTCQKNAKSYSTTNPVFDIYGDNKLVAQMKLTSYNPRRILAILEVCDWKIEEVWPVITESGETIMTSGYEYTVPVGYKVSVNGKELTEQYITDHSELPKELSLLSDYVTIPNNVTYSVEGLLHEPEVKIVDAAGAPVSFEKDADGNVNISYKPQTDLELPQDRYDLALTTAKKWMDFTTKDLKGKNYGLAEVRSYIVKGSLLYDEAEKYAKSIDITFISNHNAADNYITDLSLSEYTVYTENCFSVYVHFVKHMKLTKTGADVTSLMDSTLYFLNIDETPDDGKDNPKWLLLEMVAKTANKDGEQK